MPAINQPFSPTQPTQRVTATQANAQASINAQNAQIRIANAGPNKVFVRWGVGGQAAATTDTPILAGTAELFTKAIGDNGFAAICDTGETATVFVTTGEGT